MFKKTFIFFILFLMIFTIFSPQSSVYAESPEEIAKKVIDEAHNWMDNGLDGVYVKYVFGGYSKRSNDWALDCSSFIQKIYKETVDISLGRDTFTQWTNGVEVEEEDLLPGDLVFFSTYIAGKPTHVGIYLGDDEFLHNSSGAGTLTITNYKTSTYYNQPGKWYGARRVIDGLSGTAIGNNNSDEGSGSGNENGNGYDPSKSKFENGDVNINHIGTDERRAELTYNYVFNSYLGKVTLFIYYASQVLSVFLFGFVILLWLMHLLASLGNEAFYNYISMLTFNKVDSSTSEGFKTLTIGSVFAVLVVAIMMTGLIPKIFAFIYYMMSEIITYIT